MKKISFAIVTALLMLANSNVFAHALWIETAATGKVGKPQTVKVYYGEYADLGRDSVSTWYSDVKEFSLWLVGPDHKKTQIKVTPGLNYFEGSFTPDQDGSYTVMVSHEAKELGGTTKYHFLSSANVTVGKGLPAMEQNPNVLKLQAENLSSAKINKTFQLKVFTNDIVSKGKKVSVFSPNGWAKELTTDENGLVEFTPLWAGRYVVEVSEMDRTPGQHHGKDFKATWRGATYSFEIN